MSSKVVGFILKAVDQTKNVFRDAQGSIRGVGNEAGRAARPLSRMQRAMRSVGNAALVAGRALRRFGALAIKASLAGAAAAVAGATKSLTAYAKQEQAERSLVAALDARGDAGEKLLPILKNVASAMQDETGAADEMTLASMAQMVALGVTTDKLEEAARATVALKSVGLEASTAQRAVALAMQGNYDILNRYVPALRTANSEQEKAAIFNDLVTRGYSQQRDLLNTVAGRWNELRGRIGDAMEEIGGAIAKGSSFTGILASMSDKVKEFGERVKTWVEDGGAEEAFNKITTAVTGFYNAIKKVIDARVEIAAGLITTAVVALAVKIHALAAASGILTMSLVAGTKAAIAKAAALVGLGVAAGTATAKVAALTAAMFLLKGAGIGAGALGIYGIVHAAMEANEATKKLKRSMDDLREQDARTKEDWGVASPAALRMVRQTMQSGDQESIANLERANPQAVARWRELHGQGGGDPQSDRSYRDPSVLEQERQLEQVKLRAQFRREDPEGYKQWIANTERDRKAMQPAAPEAMVRRRPESSFGFLDHASAMGTEVREWRGEDIAKQQLETQKRIAAATEAMVGTNEAI